MIQKCNHTTRILISLLALLSTQLCQADAQSKFEKCGGLNFSGDWYSRDSPGFLKVEQKNCDAIEVEALGLSTPVKKQKIKTDAKTVFNAAPFLKIFNQKYGKRLKIISAQGTAAFDHDVQGDFLEIKFNGKARLPGAKEFSFALDAIVSTKTSDSIPDLKIWLGHFRVTGVGADTTVREVKDGLYPLLKPPKGVIEDTYQIFTLKNNINREYVCDLGCGAISSRFYESSGQRDSEISQSLLVAKRCNAQQVKLGLFTNLNGGIFVGVTVSQKVYTDDGITFKEEFFRGGCSKPKNCHVLVGPVSLSCTMKKSGPPPVPYEPE